MGHASKERVLLIGTDQRITSGPAAKRLHSKAGYMAAPERFAKKSDSFPLHRGRRPYMTHLGSGVCIAAVEMNVDLRGARVGPVIEAAARPYQSTRLSRYDAFSRGQEQS
jgi:hypothetical protein